MENSPPWTIPSLCISATTRASCATNARATLSSNMPLLEASKALDIVARPSSVT